MIQDTAGDAPAGDELASALGAMCSVATTIPVLDQDDAGLLDPVTGAPDEGVGYLLAAAGGPAVQRVVKYVEAGLSPVFYSADSQVGALQEISFVERDGGATLAMSTVENLTASHDYFVVELMVDPSSGTLVLVCYGFTSVGTEAGAWYFTNILPAKVPTLAQGWMVLEWTGQDGGSGPAMGDSFEVLAQGT